MSLFGSKMMIEKILEAVRQAIRRYPSRVRLTFKQEAARDITFIMRMERDGVLVLSDNDREFLTAVSKTGDWEGDQNRTVEVTLTDRITFKLDWFCGRAMTNVLENIEAVTD